MHKKLEDYVRLGDLLRGQVEGLHKGNIESSVALVSLIGNYAERLDRHGKHLPDLGETEKRELRPVLQQLLEDVESARQQWEEHRRMLREEQERIQSARRFASGVALPGPVGSRFLSRNA